MKSDRLQIGFAVLITLCWAISFCVDLLNPSYDPPAIVQSLILIVAGWLFGAPALSVLRRNGRANETEKL